MEKSITDVTVRYKSVLLLLSSNLQLLSNRLSTQVENMFSWDKVFILKWTLSLTGKTYIIYWKCYTLHTQSHYESHLLSQCKPTEWEQACFKIMYLAGYTRRCLDLVYIYGGNEYTCSETSNPLIPSLVKRLVLQILKQ